MPTSTDPLAACEKEFNAARADLAALQRALKESGGDAETQGKLTAAQDRFVKAGQELRRAKDPERALDIAEFQRIIRMKAKAANSRAAKAAPNG